MIEAGRIASNFHFFTGDNLAMQVDVVIIWWMPLAAISFSQGPLSHRRLDIRHSSPSLWGKASDPGHFCLHHLQTSGAVWLVAVWATLRNKQSKPSPIGRLNVNQTTFNDLRNTISSFPVRKKGGKKHLTPQAHPRKTSKPKCHKDTTSKYKEIRLKINPNNKDCQEKGIGFRVLGF